jgi:hypothetical protein
LAPWSDGQYSNVAADAARHVAYLGSFDDRGVAVINTTDPASPVLTDALSTAITGPEDTSDSADLDLVGRYLAVSHQPWSNPDTFGGISVYDTAADPYHPVLLRRIESAPVHTVQLDPEVESGRPYAYLNSEWDGMVTIVNILTGAILGQYASPEGLFCQPSEDDCQDFNFAHEGHVQRHPDSGLVLDYVSYWDSGLRIVDVTDPTDPVEVGSFDYSPTTDGNCCAHDAKPTPSADWVYLEDEIGVGATGGVRVLDTSRCDGRGYCTPIEVGTWHIRATKSGQGGPQPGGRGVAVSSSGSSPSTLTALTWGRTHCRGELQHGDPADRTTEKTAGRSAFYLPNATRLRHASAPSRAGRRGERISEATEGSTPRTSGSACSSSGRATERRHPRPE